ncbi:hypothetical protein [Methanobrevibacter sp.]|uniref:hypothetical protein n=1 Tax=Methanobrevibacter sp. TaxID=66852 RepID=UPI003D7EE649
MSDIIQDLKTEDDSVSNIELLNYVIALQLQKIEDYNSNHPSVITSKTEEAMNNLIRLLELRSKFNL